MSDGAFAWGASKEKTATQGKEGKLPRHIERMNKGTAPPEAKGSVMKGNKSMSDSGLPWGGEPAEKKKAYSSGPPKNKSMTEALGQRGANSSKLPSDTHAAHAGYSTTIKAKHASMGGMKKKK